MGGTKIAGFRPKSYKTLQSEARKTVPFQREINGMGIVQGELLQQPARLRTQIQNKTIAASTHAHRKMSARRSYHVSSFFLSPSCRTSADHCVYLLKLARIESVSPHDVGCIGIPFKQQEGSR
jgi:hypothetical protein